MTKKRAAFSTWNWLPASCYICPLHGGTPNERERNELERTEEIPQLKTNIGADGKEAEERKEIPNATAMADTMGREQPRHRKPISIFNPSRHFGHPKKRWKRDYTRLYARAAGIREGAARF